MKITEDLRRKYGVGVFSITQPCDTFDPMGEFNQNMQFLIGKYDNDLRRLRAITGMKYKLERGIWITPVPRATALFARVE